MICGTIGAIIAGVMIRRFYLKKKSEWEQRRVRAQLENARRQRMANSSSRSSDASSTPQKCVICLDNPIEVYIWNMNYKCLYPIIMVNQRC